MSETSDADERIHPRRTLIGVVGALLILAVLLPLVLWIGPAILARSPATGLTSAERLKAINDVRTALVATTVALGALAGLGFTALNLRVNRRTLQATFQSISDARAAQRSAEAAQRETIRLQRDSQIAERFSKAIELLGHEDQVDVRTGGIYALEQIAVDLPEYYHQPVVEVLASFLRAHADKVLSAPPDENSGPPRSSADLIAALEVLGRRHDAHLERRPLDLRRIRVIGAHLESADLEGAILNGAILSRTNLKYARLRSAKLSDAQLDLCKLEGVDLSDAWLDDADLRHVTWSDAILSRTNLHGARYDRRKLTEDQLSGAIEGD
jgi:hypothetical protein